MKAIKLTSHAASMNLMVEFPGNGMIPRQRFGPGSQFLMGASLKHGAQAFMAHREVAQQLQHIKQHGDRHGVQNNRLQRANHLETV